MQSPTIDAAVLEFAEWVQTSDMRPRTKVSVIWYSKRFADGVANVKVCDFGRVQADEYLAKLNMTPPSKDAVRRRCSRFFTFCQTKGYCQSNPFSRIGRARRRDDATPHVLSVDEVETLLRAAEAHHGGATVAYHGLALFGGIRPTEITRMSWANINLTDREIRLPGTVTKTRRARTIQICDCLHSWLKGREGQPIFPLNGGDRLKEVRALAGFGPDKPWITDVMRHTGISHYFRLTGSYGLSAERHGNSEGIIRAHYQGLVSSADTERFYGLRPTPK